MRGVLKKGKAKVCKKYASIPPRGSPVAIVDGGADYSILGKGFMIMSKIDNHDDLFTLNTLFSSTREEAELWTAISTYLHYNGKSKALIQVHQGCIAKR